MAGPAAHVCLRWEAANKASVRAVVAWPCGCGKSRPHEREAEEENVAMAAAQEKEEATVTALEMGKVVLLLAPEDLQPESPALAELMEQDVAGAIVAAAAEVEVVPVLRRRHT